MLLSCHTVSATDVNTSTTLARPCSSLLVKNDGTDTVYVNIKTGIAAVTGTANMPVLTGESVTFQSYANDIAFVGLICGTGDSTSVRLVGGTRE